MLSTTMFARERATAIEAVSRACKVAQKVFSNLVEAQQLTKDDKSPVTVADFSAQAVVNSILQTHFPADPIVGEEDAQTLREGAIHDVAFGKIPMLQKVAELTNSVLDTPLTQEQVLLAIDRGQFQGGKQGRFWTLDPIDGTKGFLRGEQYAICLALIVNGKVELGVLGCPNLSWNWKESLQDEKGVLYIAVNGQGAVKQKLEGGPEMKISVSSITETSQASFCESVEAGHSSHGAAANIATFLGMTQAPIRMDSQCKYGCIAQGIADIYLRLPVKKGYQEKIWDHAAGSLIVHEAGGIVSDVLGKPLDFSQGRSLAKNVGVIACNSSIHPKVLEAVQRELKCESHC